MLKEDHGREKWVARAMNWDWARRLLVVWTQIEMASVVVVELGMENACRLVVLWTCRFAELIEQKSWEQSERQWCQGGEDGEAVDTVDSPISRTERKRAGDMDGMQLEKRQGVGEKRWAADGGGRPRWWGVRTGLPVGLKSKREKKINIINYKNKYKILIWENNVKISILFCHRVWWLCL